MRKYRNNPVTVNGIRYDSEREANRGCELAMLEKAGAIADLRRQVSYELAAGVTLHGEKRKRPAIRYVADFVYRDEGGLEVVEDVKGVDTPMSRLKRHLMATRLGLMVRIIK